MKILTGNKFIEVDYNLDSFLMKLWLLYFDVINITHSLSNDYTYILVSYGGIYIVYVIWEDN